MLAYVFWHRPREGVNVASYEAELREFHARLGEEALEGVHGTATYAVDDLPWLGGPGYEDWYFLEASFALDTLNAAAVTGRVEEAHRPIAALTGGMAAGLYRLTDGVWRRQMVLGPTPELPQVTTESDGRGRRKVA